MCLCGCSTHATYLHELDGESCWHEFLEFLPYFIISSLPLTDPVIYVEKIFPLLEGNCPFGLLHIRWLGTISRACNGPILFILMFLVGLIDPFFSVVFNKDDGKGLIADGEEIKNGCVQISLEEQPNPMSTKNTACLVCHKCYVVFDRLFGLWPIAFGIILVHFRNNMLVIFIWTNFNKQVVRNYVNAELINLWFDLLLYCFLIFCFAIFTKLLNFALMMGKRLISQ